MKQITNKKLFTDKYKTNYWGSLESVSGYGSEFIATTKIRKALPKIFSKLNITTLLDIPCGDFNWMRHVDMSYLKKYIGADIVTKLIEVNQSKYSSKKHFFVELDVINDTLPTVDMIFIRDCMVHITNKEIAKTISNIKKTKSKYLMATSYSSVTKNQDTHLGKWRPINLQIPPFSLPKPLLTIDTDYADRGKYYSGNSMSIWDIKDL